MSSFLRKQGKRFSLASENYFSSTQDFILILLEKSVCSIRTRSRLINKSPQQG